MVDVHGQVARPEPLDEQLRIGVGAEEQLARRGELPGDQDLMAPGLGDDLGLAHDAFLLLIRLVVAVGQRRVVACSAASSASSRS